MSATANSGLRDAVLRSLGGGSGPVEDGLRDAVLESLGGSYVAGGPGGIPGAKEGLPVQPTQQDPWSMGAPVFDAPDSKFDPQTIRAMLAFKQNVKATGGDIDGKSDAEVFGLMQRFNQTGGNEITANDQTTTPGDEFGRGLRRGVAYGLPAGLPGVVAMRENEQVQRAPEGFAGFAGQTLGGFAGLLDPGKAPENFAAIAFTGGAGRMLAGPVEMVGKRVAQSLGAEAGARAVNMIREAVENAGQGGGIAALNEIGQIPADDWTNKPGESVWRVVKAAGVGAAAGGTLGAGFGAARKAVPVPKATLPERVFSGMLDADAAQAAREGRQAMRDVRGAYSAAPRAGEMDPAVIAAARLAELQAMEQARASAAAIGAQEANAAKVELTPEPVSAPVAEAKAPAVDSLSYTDLRKRAAALGVLKSGPQNKAALIERVTAAEAGSQAEVSPRVDTASTSKAARASEGPAPTREVPQTESSRQASDRSSPNPTRQPWEMTRDEYSSTATDKTNREDYARAWTPVTQRGTPNTIEFVPYSDGKGGVLRWNDERGIGRGVVAFADGKITELAVQKEWRRRGIATSLYKEAENRGAVESKGSITPAAMSVRHKESVRRAIFEGRPVPPEVLADYPDLAASAKPPTPAESGTTPAGTEATQAEPPKASAETTTPEAPPATVPPVEPTPTPEVAPKTPDITTPTPETRTDAAPTPKPPDDIPPRRVVNTPEPGEPEGPITGIRHAMVDADRERLGINTWDGPEVRTRQASLDQALARGINKRALDIAASIRAKPRLLNDIELAGMHHRMYEVSKEIDAKIAERDRLPDGPDKDSVTTELDRLGAEFGAIADVTQKYGGEDIARTLSYRNAIIKEDFSIARMKYRAEKAKGSKLTPEESAKIETMSKQLEEANTRIAKLEADVESARAESTVKRHASTKRAMPKEAREKIIVDLAAKARALIDTGCR